MRARHRKVLIVAAGLAMLALCGCGGGSSGSDLVGDSFEPGLGVADGSSGNTAVTRSAPLTYTVIDLGDPSRPDEGSFAFGLNNNNQVVGRHQGSWASDAFLWDNGQFTTLPSLGSNWTQDAVAINASGMMAGNGGVTKKGWALSQANTWQRSRKGWKAINLNVDPANDNYATDINDAGQIAGIIAQPNMLTAYVWDGGQLRYPFRGHVGAINNDGVVVGTEYRADREGQAYVWHPSSPDLSPVVLPGHTSGNDPYDEKGTFSDNRALDINDLGLVVGNSPTVTPLLYQGVTYQYKAEVPTTWQLDGSGQPGAAVELDRGGPEMISGTAAACNNLGVIVGRVYSLDAARLAIWDAAGVCHLLVDTDTPGWRVQDLTDINDQGRIVGTGQRLDGSGNPTGPSRAVMLVPAN